MGPRDRLLTSAQPPREADRRATWRSVGAGFALMAGVFVAMVAVSHPLATALVLAGGGATLALRGLLRRTDVDRSVQLCAPRVCFQFRVRVG